MFSFKFFENNDNNAMDNQNNSQLANLCGDIINTNISHNLSINECSLLSRTCKKLYQTIDFPNKKIKFSNLDTTLLYSEVSKIWQQIKTAYENCEQCHDKLDYTIFDFRGKYNKCLRGAHALLAYYAGCSLSLSKADTGSDGFSNSLIKFTNMYLFFATGNIFNSHADTIRPLVEIWNDDTKNNTENFIAFMNKVRSALLTANRPLNPGGRLVQFLAYIQKRSDIFAIDLFDLCLQLCDKNVHAKNAAMNNQELLKIKLT